MFFCMLGTHNRICEQILEKLRTTMSEENIQYFYFFFGISEKKNLSEFLVENNEKIFVVSVETQLSCISKLLLIFPEDSSEES